MKGSNMATTEMRTAVTAGEPAPAFTLPTADGRGVVSLADYRGRSPVFLALLTGLWCPFCRRQIARIGNTESKLKAQGVESVGIVATSPKNAQLYFRFRPTRLRLGSDPDLTTHRAYGVPRLAIDAAMIEVLGATRINPTGELPQALPVMDAVDALARVEGYVESPADHADKERQIGQMKAQFLIDREGIVRWANIECAADGVEGVGRFPTDEEILAAVRALPH
jgi:peroxiredoxin